MPEINKNIISFIVLIGKALHRYGASADRIEMALMQISDKLKVHGQYFSLPTGLYACFKVKDDYFTRMERLDPGKVNLSKLYDVDQLVDRVIAGEIQVNEGIHHIDKILNDSPLYSYWPTTFSYPVIASAISVFIGGGLYDSLISAILALMVGFLSETVKTERIDSIKDGLISFFISFLAVASTQLTPGTNYHIITLSSLIILVPGLMLTMSIGELASQNLTSGTARLMGSLLILMKISFGVFIGHIFGQNMFNIPVPTQMIEHGSLLINIMLFIVALGFTISFQARMQELPWIILASFLSYYSSEYMNLYFGDLASPFLAGSIIGAASNLYSRLLNRPSMIFLLPAIILLVPGSIGFQGLEFLFKRETIEGINSLFQTAITGTSLVAGTYFGSLLVRPKRTL